VLPSSCLCKANDTKSRVAAFKSWGELYLANLCVLACVCARVCVFVSGRGGDSCRVHWLWGCSMVGLSSTAVRMPEDARGVVVRACALVRVTPGSHPAFCFVGALSRSIPASTPPSRALAVPWPRPHDLPTEPMHAAESAADGPTKASSSGDAAAAHGGQVLVASGKTSRLGAVVGASSPVSTGPGTPVGDRGATSSPVQGKLPPLQAGTTAVGGASGGGASLRLNGSPRAAPAPTAGAPGLSPSPHPRSPRTVLAPLARKEAGSAPDAAAAVSGSPLGVGGGGGGSGVVLEGRHSPTVARAAQRSPSSALVGSSDGSGSPLTMASVAAPWGGRSGAPPVGLGGASSPTPTRLATVRYASLARVKPLGACAFGA
jgi:hypothetical protein